MNNKTAAIILAAGKGTRMKSDKPKVCFELAEKPLVQRVCDTAKMAGVSLTAVVVGYKKEEVIEAVKQDDTIVFVEQKTQNGTGDAVKVCADSFKDFDGTVFILCGDVPLLKAETLEKMHKHHLKNNASCTVLTAVLDDAGKYGRIIRDEQKNVKAIVEFKDANDEQKKIKEFNTGIYCFDSKDMFNALTKINSNNQQNEYYLTDTLEILNNENKIVTAVVLDDLNQATGVNSQGQLAALETEFYNEVKLKVQEEGVYLQNPSSIIIGEDVSFAKGVYVSANTIISGKSKIGKDVFIGSNSFIKNSEINKKCKLEGYNIVVNSKLKHNLHYQQKMLNIWPIEGENL